ncbi:MAG TPA: LysR family transcriptional regulator [Acetobacteraceae bacterium]|nr:LysR family transcriptional regulator [Acetobacteraceae bacterium]
MDRLTSMAVFVRVAECGSFAAAATALGLSSQMVGKHVRFLEERMGVRLISRTTRRQSLTEVGRAFCERCRLVLAEAETADALVEDLRAAPRGRLRVNAPFSFGACDLVPMMARYLRQHPEVSIELTLNDRVVDLVNEGCDAVIRIGPLADSTLMARRLVPYRLVASASPAYLAERGTPERPEDLARHECLGFAYWTPRNEWHFTDAEGLHAVRIRGRLSINGGQALRVAAIEGLGITMQPEGMVREDFAAGRLVRVLPGYEAPSRPVSLLFAPDRQPTPKLRSFIDAVAAAFG